MPLVGVLTSKVDNRWLIAIGFAIFAIASFKMSNLTLQMSQWSLLWPIVWSGFAAGLVFVPLSTAAMGTLSNEQIGNASGLYNFLRNIGGSIGISVVNTLVTRHWQVHRVDLSRYLTPARVLHNPVYVPHGPTLYHVGPHVEMLRKLAMIANGLDIQALTYSYVDDLRYMGVACLLCIPIVFSLRKVKARKGAVAAAH
jgi:DHA2 family multidrug resistance protein